jgi:hypothetical protein
MPLGRGLSETSTVSGHTKRFSAPTSCNDVVAAFAQQRSA